MCQKHKSEGRKQYIVTKFNFDTIYCENPLTNNTKYSIINVRLDLEDSDAHYFSMLKYCKFQKAFSVFEWEIRFLHNKI